MTIINSLIKLRLLIFSFNIIKLYLTYKFDSYCVISFCLLYYIYVYIYIYIYI